MSGVGASAYRFGIVAGAPLKQLVAWAPDARKKNSSTPARLHRF
jgi:hypothetical protein